MLIYIITNNVNGKYYIGQTKYTLKQRWQFHYSHALKTKRNTYFANAIRIHGKDCWNLEVLEKTTSDLLNEREMYWISHFNSTNREVGYNSTSGGEGYIRSKEQCEAISERMKGNVPWNKGIPRTEEERLKISIGHKGKTQTKDTKEKISKSKLIQNQSVEYKEKMKKAYEKRSKNNLDKLKNI